MTEPGDTARAADSADQATGPGGNARAADPGDAALSPDGRVHRPVVLMVLDGWGCAPDGPGNAVSLARTPAFDRLRSEYPHTTLVASGPVAA